MPGQSSKQRAGASNERKMKKYKINQEQNEMKLEKRYFLRGN